MLQLTPPRGGEHPGQGRHVTPPLLQLPPPCGGEPIKDDITEEVSASTHAPYGANAFELDLLSVIFRYL